MMAKRTTKRNASGRFERCVAKVSKRPGVASPRGVCATAGRKKYGVKEFAAMSAAGKRKAAKRKNFFGIGRKVKKAKSRAGTGYDVMDMDGYPVHTGTNLSKRDALIIAKAARADGEKVRLVRHRVGGLVIGNGRRPKQAGGVNRKVRRARKAGSTAKAEYAAKQSYKRAYQTPGRGLHANTGAAPAKKKNTGRRPAKRKNPLDAAQTVYRKFHGRGADKVLTVDEKMHVHKYLSGIGDLVGLQVLTHDGRAKVTLKFDAGAVLAQNEKRNQLFIRGGDQSVNLKDFGITGPIHELEDLGQVMWISYYTRKDHLAPEDGGEAIYKHRFGRKKPTLIYDTVNKKMELAGGGYDIPDEGIDK
jgi:hypothetical protein